ncbi:MAG TPA: UDP-N-acetylglucosamine--N-acetylmuramyl-(pentapeptide) pyrophosphoryl-undecaprenol N-acetylglucosamine transferase [Acidimicrobiia bacterium]|nr:UDP-N-acetylglucosamine--N-acetylmuramyl-(pentapeptide) pyrophosphoryl-undecaprenol N-acetylglucosamine transferase [Acidimicrobiia bacterium]
MVLISGGGTGGHVYPALALADELVARGHDRAHIRFVGATRGIEGRAVREAGYEIDLLPGRGLARDMSLRGIAQNARTVGDTARAFAGAARIVARVRPDVVVGVGGYASLPAVVAGRMRRIPVVVHESDAHPGLANRIAVALGAKAAVSLPDTALRGAVVTGNPIRPEIAAVRRAPATPPIVAVVGGSLGARRINDAALGLYDRWRARVDVVIHHVTGDRDYEGSATRLAALRAPGDALSYRLVRYEDHMDTLYAAATIIVSRAGGMTAELAAVGMPAVLVPLPGAPGDHQTRNAEVFERAGAAVLVRDADLDATTLAAAVDALLSDPQRVIEMSDAARALAHPDATARFADLVEAAARG